MQKPIYLDSNSTSQTDPRAVEAMLPFFTIDFGNPSNTLHSYGWSAENAVKQASEQTAKLIGCKAAELVWNAGATEGNNSVVFGLIRHLKNQNPNEKIHLITSNAEHWSVLNSFEAAEKYEHVDVTYVPINSEGVVTLTELKKHIKPETKLVSLIWVNNEIGSINPVQEVSEYCQAQKIYFHTDATQALGKIEIDLQKTPVHFLTFSAHKFYGPKGVGGLFIRSINPTIEIEPYIFGGGQQRNRRSGTLNVPAIVGAGRAAELCAQELKKDFTHTSQLIQNFWSELKAQLPNLKLNGPEFSKRSPVNLSIVMPQMIDLVLPSLSRLAFSQGSACQTGEASMSHVLKALGLTQLEAQKTIRFSIGRFTTQDEMTEALKIVLNAFKA